MELMKNTTQRVWPKIPDLFPPARCAQETKRETECPESNPDTYHQTHWTSLPGDCTQHMCELLRWQCRRRKNDPLIRVTSQTQRLDPDRIPNPGCDKKGAAPTSTPFPLNCGGVSLCLQTSTGGKQSGFPTGHNWVPHAGAGRYVHQPLPDYRPGACRHPNPTCYLGEKPAGEQASTRVQWC